MRDANRAGVTVAGDTNDGERIQAVQRQGHEVAAAERLVAVARRYPPQRAESLAAGRGARLARNTNLLGIADADRVDVTLAVQQHPDAASQRVMQFRHLTGQLVRNDQAGFDAATVETL
jgi:hypothetical protein